MFSFRLWLADRSELVSRAEYAERRVVNTHHMLVAKHDAMISASERSERLAGDLRDMTAERDALQAKLDRMMSRGANGKFGGKTS